MKPETRDFGEGQKIASFCNPKTCNPKIAFSEVSRISNLTIVILGRGRRLPVFAIHKTRICGGSQNLKPENQDFGEGQKIASIQNLKKNVILGRGRRLPVFAIRKTAIPKSYLRR